MNENKKNVNKLNHITPHQTIRSTTLRRDSLKKPTNLISDLVPPSTSIKHDLTNRLTRSQKISKSDKIQKFNLKFTNQSDQTKSSQKFQGYNFKSSKTNQAPTQPSQAIFELAYQKAWQNQSKQTNHLSKKPKKFNYKLQLGLVVIVMIVALLGYLNLKQDQKNYLLKQDQKVGFNTTLPSYILPGYSNINQNFQKNNFTDYFKSNLSNQNYQINESHITTSNPQQVIKKFVLFNYGIYQKIQINQITVYLSSTNDATWYNHNIWYKLINHDKTLSIQQIISIVESV